MRAFACTCLTLAALLSGCKAIRRRSAEDPKALSLYAGSAYI